METKVNLTLPPTFCFVNASKKTDLLLNFVFLSYPIFVLLFFIPQKFDERLNFRSNRKEVSF